MSKQKSLIIIIVTVTILTSLVTNVSAAPGDTIRVSVASDGTQGNGYSSQPDISANGRYVVFTSGATNLVFGDTNGRDDIFFHDRQNGTTQRVSVDSNGLQANGTSNFPAISADGRYITFASNATNLITGGTPSGDIRIYVHDMNTGLTSLVSTSSNGAIGGGAYPDISADGRFIAFSSGSPLVSGDTNGAVDVFVHDRQNSTTTRVSVNSNGIQGNGGSFNAAISPDGQYVAFSSYSDNLVNGDTNGVLDIFSHNIQTSATVRVSVNSDDMQGNNTSGGPFSTSGRFVAFNSRASNLIDGDINGRDDIFVHDLQTGITELVSRNINGLQGNGYSALADITTNGRFIVFFSGSDNLVDGDINDDSDIFVHDMQTGETIIVSIASNGQQANLGAFEPSISPDGRYVVFASNSDNLVSGDTNGTTDIFVNELNWNTEPALLPATGFPRGQITALHQQPAEKVYANTDLVLEIPTLNKKMSIVGVPQSGDSWDLTWLGNNAGWLNGSAFPTWNGNTVLTGHVWDAYNQPGSFANLKSLKYDDQILIHAFGQTYTYEVRENGLVAPKNIQTVMKHEKLDWVTLVTCEFYNPVSENYLFRRVVKAVLVSVK